MPMLLTPPGTAPGGLPRWALNGPQVTSFCDRQWLVGKQQKAVHGLIHRSHGASERTLGVGSPEAHWLLLPTPEWRVLETHQLATAVGRSRVLHFTAGYLEDRSHCPGYDCGDHGNRCRNGDHIGR